MQGIIIFDVLEIDPQAISHWIEQTHFVYDSWLRYRLYLVVETNDKFLETICRFCQYHPVIMSFIEKIGFTPNYL